MAIGSTFIADLSNGIALEISTARFPSYGQLIVRNAILRGGASSGGRDFRVTDDDGFGPKAAAGDLDFSSFRSGRTQGPFGGGLTLGDEQRHGVAAAARQPVRRARRPPAGRLARRSAWGRSPTPRRAPPTGRATRA